MAAHIVPVVAILHPQNKNFTSSKILITSSLIFFLTDTAMCREVAWVELALHWDTKHDQDGVVFFVAIGDGWRAFARPQREFRDVGV